MNPNKNNNTIITIIAIIFVSIIIIVGILFYKKNLTTFSLNVPEYSSNSISKQTADKRLDEFTKTDPNLPIEYDLITKNKIKETNYNEDEKTISYIDKYDLITGEIIPKTTEEIEQEKIANDKQLNEFTKTDPSFFIEFDPITKNKIKETKYTKDGKKIRFIQEFDRTTKNKIKYTSYKLDGKTILYIHKFDPKTGKLIYNYNKNILNQNNHIQ